MLAREEDLVRTQDILLVDDRLAGIANQTWTRRQDTIQKNNDRCQYSDSIAQQT